MQGLTPTNVYRELESDERFSDRLPSKRTVVRRAKEAQTADTSGAWSIETDETDNPGAVLDVLSAVISFTQGRIRSISTAEATWIVHIREVRPDAPTMDTYLLARFYLVREAKEAAYADLDMYLAFAPWRGEAHESRYREAVKAGWVQEAPLTLGGLVNSEHREDEEIFREMIAASLEVLGSQLQGLGTVQTQTFEKIQAAMAPLGRQLQQQMADFQRKMQPVIDSIEIPES